MAQAQEHVTISIRLKARQGDLIDQAAERLGCSRSDFVLEAACWQAEDVLRDLATFALDATGFAAHQDRPANPPEPTDHLRHTLKAKAPWDTAGAVEGKTSGQRPK